MKHLAMVFVVLVGLAVAGSSAFAQLLLVEDFDYPEGDSLKLHDWVMTGSPSGYSYVNPVSVVAPGLTFPGYRGSGVGNAAGMAPTGQDVSRYLSAPAASGSVYAFMMVSVSAARTSGDYFFHMISGSVTSSAFALKLSVKASSGRVAFGVSKRANASGALYTGYDYGLDTTYLLVMKYTFVPDSSNDDEVSLFVFRGPSLPRSEPAVPAVGPGIEAGASDVDSLCLCALRQGSSSSAPTLAVDGIRIATTWESVLPIQISSFRGVVEGESAITLSWTTESEIDNYGFEVQRSDNSAGGFGSVSGLIPGHNTTNEPQSYSYTDRDVPAGRWFYRLKSIAMDQSVAYSEVIEVANVADVGDGERVSEVPIEFGLEQNYPNPFNPRTEVRSQMSEARHVRLVVYDLLGREVAVLADGWREAGRYRDLFDGSNRASGTYICRMVAGGFVAARRMVLIR